MVVLHTSSKCMSVCLSVHTGDRELIERNVGGSCGATRYKTDEYTDNIQTDRIDQ